MPVWVQKPRVNQHSHICTYVLKQVVGYKSRKTSVISMLPRPQQDVRPNRPQSVMAEDKWSQCTGSGNSSTTQLVPTTKKSSTVEKCLLRALWAETRCEAWGMSPSHFNLYMDGLWMKLLKSGVGCSFNRLMTNHTAYVDDMMLLAPSVSAMYNLLKICEEYPKKHNMRYNSEIGVYGF